MSKKSNDESENLVGFKDFLDGQSAYKHKRPSRKADSEGNYGLFTFLERESIRLSKTLNFLDTKVLSLKNNPQGTYLVEQEKKRLAETKKKLLKEMIKKESTATKNISELLESHFKN